MKKNNTKHAEKGRELINEWRLRKSKNHLDYTEGGKNNNNKIQVHQVRQVCQVCQVA